MAPPRTPASTACPEGHRKTTRRARVAALALAVAALWTATPALAANEATEAELRDEYARWAIGLGSYEYRARHLLVATREEAASALGEINGGATFASVASRVSLDTGSKAKGGDLGWVLPGHFVPEFRIALRNMETGLHPAPVKTAFGWHVILIEEVRQVRVPRFEDMRSRIEAQLQRNRPAESSAPAKPLPAWTAEQWSLVFAAAQHTAGIWSYVYRVAQFNDLDSAQRGAAFRLAAEPIYALKEHRARNLIDVDPALRLAVSRLFSDSAVSAPVSRVLADGRRVWNVIQLVSRSSAERLQPTEPFKADLASWVDKGLLPSPEQLAQPAAQARTAYWRATSEAQIDVVAAPLSADVEYGNTSTPLLDAILRTDMAGAKALLRRGADANRCGSWGCPITFAANMKDEAAALAWVDWLLRSGAKADARDARAADLFDTALGAAAWNGHRSVAQRLVEAGAAVDGEAGAGTTPIEAAAAAGNQPMVEWLIARGASVLPRPDRTGITPHSIHAAARESNNEALVAWSERQIMQAAAQSPLFKFTLHFEQSGRRIEPNAKGEVALKAAPFKMVFRFPEGVHGVQVGASLQAAWLDEVGRTDLRNAMFRPFASGALANADAADSKDLLLSNSCAADAKADPGCEGTYMSLGIDESVRKDFHERRTQGGQAYVREVAMLFDTAAAPMRKAESLPLSRMAGKTLYMAVGVPVALGGPTGLRLVQPRLLKLQLTP